MANGFKPFQKVVPYEKFYTCFDIWTQSISGESYGYIRFANQTSEVAKFELEDRNVEGQHSFEIMWKARVGKVGEARSIPRHSFEIMWKPVQKTIRTSRIAGYRDRIHTIRIDNAAI